MEQSWAEFIEATIWGSWEEVPEYYKRKIRTLSRVDNQQQYERM